MKNAILKFVKKPAVLSAIAFTGVYALALMMIFWGAWSLDKAPIAPDCHTTFPIDDAAQWCKMLIAGRDFIPSDLMHFIGSMYFWFELQFALAAYLAALGVAFYLRGRGLSRVACYSGGAAFGLMGYCFTLFSAGHLGWFQWMMYGPFAFGLTDRAVRKGKWLNWVLLGAVLAWAGARQPDLWLLFTLLTFAYGVWCLIRERKTIKWGRTFAGVAVTAVAALLVGAPQFLRSMTQDIAGREKQISGNPSAEVKSGKEQTAAEKEKAREQRWLFCTSWSLPPEDTLEFAFAEIHGGSNDPRIFQKPGNKPYKGRLGQRGIVPQGASGRHPVTGEMLKAGDEFWMPYRQHSLYFGIISLLLSVAGCVGWFVMRKRGDGKSAWCDAPFWIGAAGIVYLCALGGFTPFYKLVFALPFGDVMRCPVKFVHLLELCVAVLAGYGIEFVRVRFGEGRAWIVPALVVVAVVNVFDLVRVDAKYLAVQDVSFARAPNEAAEDMRKLGGGKVFVAMAAQEGEQLIRNSLDVHLAETTNRKDDADVRFVLAGGSALRSDAVLMDQMRSGALKVAGSYALSQKRGIFKIDQSRATVVLLQKPDVSAPPPKENPPPDRGKQVLGFASLFSSLFIAAYGILFGGIFRNRSLR